MNGTMETLNIVKAEPFAFSECIIDPLKEELRACRMCLCIDRRMYNLHHYKINGLITFADTLAELLGTPVDQSDGLPQHLCSICVVQFQRCAEFRAHGRRSHQTLVDILQQHHEVTATYLQTIEPTQKYSITKPHIEDIKGDNTRYDVEIKDEKHEQILEINLNNTDEESNGLISLEVNEPSQTSVNLSTKEKKIESKVKLKKTETKTKPRRVTKVKKKIELSSEDSASDWADDTILNEDNSSSDVKNESKIDLEEKLEKKSKRVTGKRRTEKAMPKKKKRLYNEKDEEDYEEIRRQYNMDFKLLSLEEQIQLIQDRKTRRDPPTAEHQCQYCYKWFVHEVAYKRHMPVHEPISGEHACEICKYRFPNRSRLLAHKRRHRIQFVCRGCPRVFHNSHLAKVHHLWHQGHTFICRHCHKQFRSESTYLNHIREQHTVLVCEECGGRLDGSKALLRHMEDKHGIQQTKKKPRYKYPQQAQKVKERKVKEQKTEDSIGKVGKPEAERTDDEKAEKKPKVENRFICEVCGKRLPSRAVLIEHHRIHTGEKPFACTDCPKTFRTKMLMKIHHNVHTGARPFQCHHCPERFRSYTLRYKHGLMVHVKPQNKCHLCEKTYNIMDDLRSHIRHTHMKVPRPKRARRNRRKEAA